MRRPVWLLITLPIVVSVIGATRIDAQSHADAAAPKVAPSAKPAPVSKDAHVPREAHTDAVVTPATLHPPTHKLSDPSAGHNGPQERLSRSTKSAGSPPARHETEDEPDRHVPRTQEPGDKATDKPVSAKGVSSPSHARPPNPALEAVLQRIARRVSGAKPARGSTARAPRTTAAASPLFRVQVTAPRAPSPSETPRVRLTWRPTVVWPRAVLPGGDADTRVQVDWSH